MAPQTPETHDEGRHFADEAAARFHAAQPSPDPVRTESAETPAAADPPLLWFTKDYLETGEIHGRTIAQAIDLAQTNGCGSERGKILYPLSPQERERLVERLLPRWGEHQRHVPDPDIFLGCGDGPTWYPTGDKTLDGKEMRDPAEISPSARLNLLAAGQSLAPSSPIRREMAVTNLDLSDALDHRRPIDPTNVLKIQSVLEATHTDLEGLAAQGLVASTRANAGFGDLVGRAVDALVTGTNNAMEALSAGALQRTFESETRVQRGAITDARGRVISPATEQHSHSKEVEQFPARTKLQAGGGTVRVIGAPVSIRSGFNAAAAALAGGSGRVDPDARVSAHVGPDYAEASGYGDSVVAAAGGGHVEIGAPSATITFGPTTISRR